MKLNADETWEIIGRFSLFVISTGRLEMVREDGG
jgi:hypothetical protein